VTSLGVSADGRHFAAIDGHGHLSVRERNTDRELAPPWPTQRTFGLRFAPADASLAVIGHDGVLRVWNLDTDFFVALTGEVTTYSAPAFTPDGRHLATCAMNGRARVWPTPDLRARVLRGHESRSLHVRFLPDGRLASDSDGDSQVVALHQDRVYGLAVAPDGRLADFGFDGVARVWDPATGASVALTGHAGRVRTVDFHARRRAGDRGGRRDDPPVERGRPTRSSAPRARRRGRVAGRERRRDRGQHRSRRDAAPLVDDRRQQRDPRIEPQHREKSEFAGRAARRRAPRRRLSRAAGDRGLAARWR
jgi:hypothetical protein